MTPVVMWTRFPSAFGPALVAETSQGVCGLFFGDSSDPSMLASRFPSSTLVEGGGHFSDNLQELLKHWTGDSSSALPPVSFISGTPFQQRVWSELQKIPAGSTLSYTQLAEKVGNLKAVRAVAQACGANPVAVLVPCHRVVRKSGDLGGYAYGLSMKRLLLSLESPKSAIDKENILP